MLARVAACEPRLNAFVALDAERARAAARAAEAAVTRGETLGPLHGVPVTIKDIQAVEGLPTRRGSRLSDPAPATADAPLVARLRAAGRHHPRQDHQHRARLDRGEPQPADRGDA